MFWESHVSYPCMTKKTDIELLFRTHYAAMYRLARALLHDDDIARDVVQDVFVSLFNNGSVGKITGSYLLSGVRNRCLNHLRDLSIHDRLSSLYLLELQDSEREDWPDEETLRRLSEMLDSALTPQCRRVVEMRYRDGLSYTGIASGLGISESTVYKHLRHAIEIMRKKFKLHG